LPIRDVLSALQRLDGHITAIEATTAEYSAQLDTLGRQFIEAFKAEAADEVDRLVRETHAALRTRAKRAREAQFEEARSALDAQQKRTAGHMDDLVTLFVTVLLGQT
jgi:hypothetical protein